jgi:hypothetical protein
MQTKFKKFDITYWQCLLGEVIDIDSFNPFPVRVKFTNGLVEDFTNDGRLFKNTPPVLSHTPYTLNSFTQNSVIEKDTLVWVRYNNYNCWEQRFYSHFKDGIHYCFESQKTSKETSETTSWKYLETENPLLKKINP